MFQICYYSEYWKRERENREKGPVKWRKLRILLAQIALPRSSKNNVNDDRIMNTISIEHFVA